MSWRKQIPSFDSEDFPIEPSRFSFSALKNSWPLRFLLAGISGLLNVTIFPRIDLSWLCWIALVPLLVAGSCEKRLLRAFLTGSLAGAIFFLGNCYWIINVLIQYGGLPPLGAFFCLLLLVAFLACFYGAFLLAFCWMVRFSPISGLTAAPFFWVGLEYLRTYLLTGFPWSLMGYALVDQGAIVLLSRWTGVYGLSWLVLSINCAAVWLAVNPSRTRRFRRVLAGMALVLAVAALSLIKVDGIQSAGDSVRIVQPNLSPDQVWTEPEKTNTLDSLGRLSLEGRPAVPRGGGPASPGLLVWPETPAPFYFHHDSDFRARMRELARQSGEVFVFGFVDLRPSERAELPDPYNSLAVVSPRGEMLSQYDKIHLVPFGEYIPYPRLFFFIEKISTEAGNFIPGTTRSMADLGARGKMGAFICYEAIFPDLVRRFVREGATVLVNITNDGWFGDSAAPHQHLNMARLRAVENNRYLVRAANNGISAIIDPQGKVLARTRTNEKTALSGTFSFQSETTFYSHHGDVFAWACVLTAAGMAFLGIFFSRRPLKG
jgi:apolipoprotein N-acyltransferase